MTKATPKIAIITKSHGRPLLLDRAIQSIENQTYGDYIHVIFNDGEDARAVDAIARKYNNPRRRIIHSAANLGVTKALNKAIRAVNSTYIAILDDDDTWSPERLEKTVNFLDETGAKAVVVKTDIIIEEIVDGQVRTISQLPHPESREGEVSLYKQCIKNYVSNGIVTYRRDVYDELGGYDEALETAEDWDFGLRLLLKYDIAYLDTRQPLFFYHQRPNQSGVEGNEVHAGVLKQEKTINKLRNRYLRQDLAVGRLGVGYIMNSTTQDLAILTTVKGHIDYSRRITDESIAREINALFGRRKYVRRGIKKIARSLKLKK